MPLQLAAMPKKIEGTREELVPIENRPVGGAECSARDVFREYIALPEKARTEMPYWGLEQVGAWNEIQAEANALARGLQGTIRRLRALIEEGKILDEEQYINPTYRPMSELKRKKE